MARRLRIARTLFLLGVELDFDGNFSFDEDDEGVMEFLLLRLCLRPKELHEYVRFPLMDPTAVQ